MKILEGKRAVITGGSVGIGFAIAEAFVKHGADVLLISRDRDKLKNAASELAVYGQKVETFSFDLANLTEIPNLVREIQVLFPKVDILVNNAALGFFERIENVKVEDITRCLEVNVQSPYLLTQQLLPLLKVSKGNIINISSYFSHKMIHGRFSSLYSMTKGAIDSFTKALASELGECGVRVNGIAPGSVRTPLFNSAMDKMEVSEQQKFMNRIKTLYPLQRIGEPEDLGGAAVFLASDQASWVTGSIISVDGGLTIE